MGEKVSEAPAPVPRGARTPAPAAASSLGASSAESSSGSETLSEEGEPGGFSRPPPPPPPGGALGPRPPAAWAPTRAVLELGVSAPPGGAAPPAPRGSSASQEELDEEVGAAFPHPPRVRLRGTRAPSRAGGAPCGPGGGGAPALGRSLPVGAPRGCTCF